MSTYLDPVIQEKLRAFAARRRRLIITRGVFAAMAMLLLTMLIIAGIDLQVRMPDWLRWALSGTAYLAVLVIAWRQCLSWLLRAPDERQLARLVEHAEPRLREDLLSAVELGRTNGGVFDSEQFRALLQDDVAGKMERLEVNELLPVKLVRRYIGYALAVLCIVGAMVAATGWQFPTLLLRALWPSANLDRISRTKVLIVEPEGGNKLVPQGDTVRIVVELGGERAQKASIITETVKEGWQAADMQPLGGARFAATVNVGRENVRYRIEAGDAVTRFFVLDARERPFITEFEKTYVFPEYSRLPVKKVTEQDGALIGLDGATVDLRLKPNQPMKSAELRLEIGKKSSTIPLVKTEDGRLAAKVPLNASGTYRVALVAAETGFENKFSPENEIRAEPDLVPTVELESPKADLILPNNELVDLVGNASDDLGLAKISQVVKVNDGPWREFVIKKEMAVAKEGIDHRWDLYEQKVNPGDLLVTKLVATDLKGNRGESRPLQITIVAAGFELRKLQGLESLRALNLAVIALADKSDELSKAGNAVRDVISRSEDAGERRLAMVAYGAILTEMELKFTECWTSLGAALRDAPQGHLSAELVLVGRELGRLKNGSLAEARAQIDILSANPTGAEARELARFVVEAAAGTQQRSRIAWAAVEAFTTSEELAILAENGQVVAKEQQRVLELAMASGDDDRKWAGLVPRLRVAMTQARSLEELMEPTSRRSLSRAKDRARRAVSEISKRRVKLEAALLGEPTQKALLNTTTDLTRIVQDFSREFTGWHRELGYEPVKMVDELLRDVGPTYENVTRIQNDLQMLKGRANLAEGARNLIAEVKWKYRGEALKVHGDLEELRVNADNEFVGDLRQATIAFEALRQVYDGGDKSAVDARFSEMDRNLRLLESGHNLREVFDGLNFLATNERWELRNLSARTQAPRDWRWLEKRMREIPNELGKAKQWFDQKGADEQAVRVAFEGAQKILWSAGSSSEWQGVNGEMEQRSKPEHSPVSVKAQTEVLAGQVKKAMDLLRPHMDEARRRMDKLSPSIAELAQALANEQEKLKEETTAEAKADAPKKEDPKADAAAKLAAQQKLNEKIETLKDLIRAEANQKDILKAEEREAMRDADDALALLKEPPPKAEEALEDAVKDSDAQQKADFERAAEQQAKAQDALAQIAKHFDAVEKGKDLAETRAALREAEKELGIKEQLDQQQAHAKMIAEMAQKNPDQLLKELESKLAANPEMQKELSDIAKDTLGNAEQKLNQAAKQESKIAESVKSPSAEAPAESAAQAAKEAQAAAEAAHTAAKNAELDAGEAKNEAAKRLADQAAESAKDAAKEAGKAVDAAEKMATASKPEDAAKFAQRAAEKAQKAADLARQAAQQAEQSQAASKQAAQNGGEKQAQNNESAKDSAEAAAQAQKAAESARKAANLAQQAAAKQDANSKASQEAKAQPAQTAANEAAKSAGKAADAAKAAQKAAESAEAKAAEAGNQDAAKQADAAGNEAGKAAEAAQAAAEDAKSAAESGDAKQAAAAAEKAAQKSGEAAQAAEKAAAAAQNAENAAQQAAQSGGEKQGENQQAAQQSGEAKQQAQAAAQAAKQAQAQAQQAANAAKAAAAQQNQQLAAAAQQQPAIANDAAEAAAEVGRAARHEMRLGNQTGEQLAKLGNDIQETAQSDVPAAQNALANAAKPADAAAAVQNAAAELGAELAQLKAAQQSAPPSPNSGTPPGESPGGQPSPGAEPSQNGQPSQAAPAQAGPPASPAEQQAMARALDALDQQLNAPAQSPSQGAPAEPQQGQPGQPGQDGPSAQSAAASAMAQAAQAAQASMRQSRAEQGTSQTPGSLLSKSQSDKSEGGAQLTAGGDYKLTTTTQGLKKGEWGKLPKKLADQLTKGQQEAVAGDYRQAVETYYKVIAEKAKEQKK